MRSQITEELKMKYHPVAVLFTDSKPEGARQLREGQWGCAMALYSNVMRKGATAAFDRKTYGCIGAGVGLCLGDTYKPNRNFMLNLLADEEGYFKSRELAAEFTDNFEFNDIPFQYVIFKPLDQIDPDQEEPALVSFPVNADQLSALAALINFRRTGNEHVAAPFGAGCQSVCVLPYNESKKEFPRAVIGNLDLSSRKVLPFDILTFTVPYKTFLEMEVDVPASFFRKETWAKIVKRIGTP